ASAVTAAPSCRTSSPRGAPRRGRRAASSRPVPRTASPGAAVPPRAERAVRPTLYEFAGGDDAFLALATAHHARCLADPELNHPFSHPDQHPQHVERLAAYWAEVLGGPPRF